MVLNARSRRIDLRTMLSVVAHSVLMVLGFAMLAACNSSPATTSPGSTSTPIAQVTGTPEEISVDATVTSLEIWQDYMPVVPKDGAPLYGVVTVEITHTEKLTPQVLHGVISLKRSSGTTIASGVPTNLQQQSDDLGLLSPGPQTVVLTFGLVNSQATLTEGEKISGTLELTIEGRPASVPLPESALFFTH